MKIFRVSTIVIGCLFYSSANAGLFGLTHFSRANCINNESISWDDTRVQIMRVHSNHKQYKYDRWHPNGLLVNQHNTASESYPGWKTVRFFSWPFAGAKAIHWFEGQVIVAPYPHKWRVQGIHDWFITPQVQSHGWRRVRSNTDNCFGGADWGT